MGVKNIDVPGLINAIENHIDNFHAAEEFSNDVQKLVRISDSGIPVGSAALIPGWGCGRRDVGAGKTGHGRAFFRLPRRATVGFLAARSVRNA